jgi:hypothetical protein
LAIEEGSLARIVLVALLIIGRAALADILWVADFETADISQWMGREIIDDPSNPRVMIVDAPVAQGLYALRVLVRQGDDPVHASGNRNELVGPTDNEGDEYFYRWSTLFDDTYPSENTWQVFTQVHHNGCCGSPPIEFYVYGEEIRFLVRQDPFQDGTILWSTPMVRGVWHDFTWHVKWSSDPNQGFVELYYNGDLVVPVTNVATMYPGMNVYLKQGLYRNAAIVPDGIVYHDAMIKGETLSDVMP